MHISNILFLVIKYSQGLKMICGASRNSLNGKEVACLKGVIYDSTVSENV